MAPSTALVLSTFLSALPPTLASPIASKRSPSPHNLGMGFAIALSLLLLASLTFYLGVLHGRTGTWVFWRARARAPPSLRSPSPLGKEKPHPLDPATFKQQISAPVEMMHSTALPELSPIAAAGAPPRYAELSSPVAPAPPPLELAALEKALHAYEMGPTTPRRPPSVASRTSVVSRSFYSSRKSSVASSEKSVGEARGVSFLSSRKSSVATVGRGRVSVRSVKSMAGGRRGKSVYSCKEAPPRVGSWVERERKSWFCRGAMEVESEVKKGRGGDMEEQMASAPAPASATVVMEGGDGEKRGTMDWSGMEWLSKVYGERKSRRLSGMRSFYIPDAEEK